MINKIIIYLMAIVCLEGCYSSLRMITTTYSIDGVEEEHDLSRSLNHDLRPVIKLDETTYFRAGRGAGFYGDKVHGNDGLCTVHNNKIVVHIWTLNDKNFYPANSYFIVNNKKILIVEITDYRNNEKLFPSSSQVVNMQKTNNDFQRIKSLEIEKNVHFTEITRSNKYLVSAEKSLGCLNERFILSLSVGDDINTTKSHKIYFYPAEFITTKQ